MLIPLSWLKEYVNIKTPLNDLMWKMTEAGLTCESYKSHGEEKILDVEVTPNRPDWMSIIGVAREIAALEGVKVSYPKIEKLPPPTTKLPLSLVPNFDLIERWSGIIIKDVGVSPSPKWLADRIRQMGHEPINNIVDVTNFVMYELGIPMHAFDYDEIKDAKMTVKKSQGGENFVSVDKEEYVLPKDAIVIWDGKRLIDLSGIKGGNNSGIKSTTKNIFLHVTINNPTLIRRASISLGLRSDASAIYERGPDKGSTINSLIRATNILLDIAGGQVASDIFDLKKNKFEPWTQTITLNKLEKVLGISISEGKVKEILDRLGLTPKKIPSGFSCTIPTYRQDIKIEEDLIEEVARIYGYNKFPKTLPITSTNPNQIPYNFSFKTQDTLSNILTASGFSEVMTLSLISTELIESCLLDPKKHVTLDNPVSLDYEHLRTSLIPSLLTAVKLNHQKIVKIFEIDKVFPEEEYKIASVSKGLTFRQFKGVVDLLLQRLNINDYKIDFHTNVAFWHPFKSATVKVGSEQIGQFGAISPQVLANLNIKQEIFAFEFDIKALQGNSQKRSFKIVPEVPERVEDLTISFPPKTRIGEVVAAIHKADRMITGVSLKDIYKDSFTFEVTYQDQRKTLTDQEVLKIRKKILAKIKSGFGGVHNG